jgi:dihydrofolate reductase
MRWNSTLLPADGAIDAIRELKQRDGRDLVSWGSPTLVRDLIANDLVDELCLYIEPVVLGGGKRIFSDDGQKVPLEVVSAKSTGSGVQMVRYRPASG